MTDMLQKGLDWLEGQRRAYMARTVTYRRGADSVEVTATIGSTRIEIDDGYGVVIETESRDYLMAAVDLVLDDEQVLPERGDEILEVGSENTHVYEVMDLGAERHYRWCDPKRTTLRIHTKQTEIVT